MRRVWLGIVLLSLAGLNTRAAEPEYRTVETAISAKIQPQTAATAAAPSVPPFLGISVGPSANGVTIEDVQPGSPAEKAGLKIGDILTRFDGKDVAGAEPFRSSLKAKAPGDSIKVVVRRKDQTVEATVALIPVSRPLPAPAVRPVFAPLGLTVSAAKDGKGVTVDEVRTGSVAEQAKLKVGETILKVDATDLTGPDKLREALTGKRPDDTVTLTLLLAEKQVEMKLKLPAEGMGGGPGQGFGRRQGGWDSRGNRYWTKPTYKLAIILVEYPDAKHNAKITPKAWEEAMFSRDGTYKSTATGQTAYGTMYDYYLEQSYGNLKIEGKAFDYVEVNKKRMDYNTGSRTALLTEALDKLLARDGKDALKDFDGVFYIYAGGRMQVARGSLYWPHRASVQHNGKNWPYFICPEGGERMANISVFCHEFGHMLGLPDLYARPENPGSEGLGIWCAMANQAGNGRPQHFSAWCKEKLEWVKPTVIDPTVKQKLALAPIESSPRECFKVLVRPDGSEYLLLENRTKKGFDQSLPAEGLLIWRVVGNRPILEESHGVEGPAGPRVFMDKVPFPSSANDAFTPFTTPSSRSQLGGGLPVHITNIKRLPDGKVMFHIGYEYQ
jgi:M6 family metalloprotease-like protein